MERELHKTLDARGSEFRLQAGEDRVNAELQTDPAFSEPHALARRGFEVLDAMRPPDGGMLRVRYRAWMTEWIASLGWDDVRALCSALGCDITRVVGKAMDYEFGRARRFRGSHVPQPPSAGESSDHPRGRGCHTAGIKPEGRGATRVPPSGAGRCCLCGRQFPLAGSRGPWKARTVRRVSSAPARVRALVADRGIADKDAMLCLECRIDLLEGVQS